MDIFKLIGKKTGEENQIERFEKRLEKTTTKRQIRNAEMHLLKPKPIPRYTGQSAGRTLFQKCSLLLVFPDIEYVKRIGNLFNINSYIQNNTYDIDFIIELIRLMETKRIKWNRSSKKFYVINKNGKKIRII